ncbi:hypothetical protein F4810DRAFT_679264 [Camillea tinctor]|nr:hypothetical protein F4810DRAFT_679264 [Camillea tinctor]
MTTIFEEEEMDYINWDAAADSTGFDLPAMPEGVVDSVDSGVPGSLDEPNMNLVFENVDGDDWSYWALEHYESTQMAQDRETEAPVDPSLEVSPPVTSQMYWETPESPCLHCIQGKYQCKRIREGKYRGYCTSCVALRCECSFGPSTNNLTAEAGATFPANPWPIMGDRPATSIVHEDDLAALITTAPPAPGLTAVASDQPSSPKPLNMPKIGARFSRESVKVLKNWLVTHSRHPYPTDEEKENLQKITGLNKTQITNWLANARRRGKVQPTRATSPHVGGGYAQAIDIPRRPGTPRLESMNPLQRWANSPPENEPASVTAIARAVSASGSYSQTSGSGRNSPFISNYSDDGSSRSLCNQSSVSSLGTSHSSGGSFASLYSNQSRVSFNSISSYVRNNRGRRRRRRAPPKRADEPMAQPLKTFQCTFCTETFRTKHDWQRHEKSLHLSLERWICSPDGAKSLNPENGLICCVFCGEPNPDDAHIDSHNYSGCTERTQEERTFYRKDHLRQHLRLVHNVKYLAWAMDKWRLTSPEIRSRCGFCGIVLDSWTIRTDHLAEHFKTGNTMADWKGDWGFEAPVLEMVENSIPPYLIHDERMSPLPFMASLPSPSTPNNAYELLKLELQYWIPNTTDDTGQIPTDADIQREACRIIFGTEIFANSDSSVASPSWLRDLVMSSDEARHKARFSPIRAQSENRMSSLRINGKRDIFEGCDFEKQLREFVNAKILLGLTAMDSELQTEACRIIGRAEEKSSNPSEALANWVLRLINSSSKWLQGFRQRAHLPRSEDVGDAFQRSKDPKTIDSTIHNYTRLDAELGEYLQQQRSLGVEPTDAALQRQARIIIYEVEDGWNQTAADDKAWLDHFRQRYPPKASTPMVSTSQGSPSHPGSAPAGSTSSGTPGQALSGGASVAATSEGGKPPPCIRAGPYFLNDANCFRRLARGLSRFVVATTSPNNPNCHVPTDQELQHQARWIVYDDDDPWNQTAADNAEWLQRFKVDVGILPPEYGPGLLSGEIFWATSQGGTGFAPPYVSPNPAAALIATAHPSPSCPSAQPHDSQDGPTGAGADESMVFLRHEARGFQSGASTANRFLQTFTRRYAAPARIFCSRELESGLTEYVRREVARGGAGSFPSDERLRARAREIMGMQKTACDDPVLLAKFKAALQQGATTTMGIPGFADSALEMDLPATLPARGRGLYAPPTATAMDVDLDLDLDMNFTDQEINDILQDVSPDFSGGGNTPAQNQGKADPLNLNPSPASSSSSSLMSLFGGGSGGVPGGMGGGGSSSGAGGFAI